MKINIETRKKVDLSKVKYGDVLVLENGDLYLIIADTDGDDYVGVNLRTLVPTAYKTTIEELLEYELDDEKVVDVINGENITIGVC